MSIISTECFNDNHKDCKLESCTCECHQVENWE
jgi:hypothetical protein